MSHKALPELPPEHADAHKIAARELVRYWQEFGRWRAAKRTSGNWFTSPRMWRLPFMPLTEKPRPPERHA